MNNIKTITIQNQKLGAQNKTIISKVLPLLLIVSFMFANIFYVAQGSVIELTNLNSSQYEAYFFFELIVFALIDYVVMLLVLWIYRSVLSFRPYFYLVDKDTFNEKFKIAYLIKNVIYGAACFALFFVPHLQDLFLVLDLILSFMVVVLTYVMLKNKIDIMFRHFYFKLLMYPWFIFQAISILITIVLGGY